jgi:hypothetical protein
MSEAAHVAEGGDRPRADDGDDAAVIARSMRSPECFGTIFHRHAPAICRYVARLRQFVSRSFKQGRYSDLDILRQVLDNQCQGSGEGRQVIRTELVDQLIRLVDVRLLDPLEILLDGDQAVGSARAVVTRRAEAWASVMLGPDEQAATRMIVRVIASVYPQDGPFEPPADWWRTPLGQVALRRVGHPSAQAVSYSVAGAMLGITRQGVHDLVTRHKLERHPEGGVTVESVRARAGGRPGR